MACRGNVIVNENGQTSLYHVCAGGDVATGAAKVILGIEAVKKVVPAIDLMLRKQ